MILIAFCIATGKNSHSYTCMINEFFDFIHQVRGIILNDSIGAIFLGGEKSEWNAIGTIFSAKMLFTRCLQYVEKCQE